MVFDVKFPKRKLRECIPVYFTSPCCRSCCCCCHRKQKEDNNFKSYIIIVSLVFSRGKDKYWSEIGSCVGIWRVGWHPSSELVEVHPPPRRKHRRHFLNCSASCTIWRFLICSVWICFIWRFISNFENAISGRVKLFPFNISTSCCRSSGGGSCCCASFFLILTSSGWKKKILPLRNHCSCPPEKKW